MDGRHDYLFGIVASCVDLSKPEVEDAVLEGSQVRCVRVLAGSITEGTGGAGGRIPCWAFEDGPCLNTERTLFRFSTGRGRASLGFSSSFHGLVYLRLSRKFRGSDGGRSEAGLRRRFGT